MKKAQVNYANKVSVERPIGSATTRKTTKDNQKKGFFPFVRIVLVKKKKNQLSLDQRKWISRVLLFEFFSDQKQSVLSADRNLLNETIDQLFAVNRGRIENIVIAVSRL